MVHAADVCAANPCHELIRAIFMPTVSMIRQPPKLVPIPMVSAHSKDDPEGDLEDGGGATRQHRQRKHTHEFLAVVQPMIECHERSGEDLEA